MGESERENELAALEARLGAFQPGASRLDRDLVMYRAGRAAGLRECSAHSGRWRWPSAFGAMTAVAAVLLLVVVIERREGEGLTAGAGAGLTQGTDVVSPVVTDEGSESGESGGEVEADLDALLARLPAGRGLVREVPWVGVDSDLIAVGESRREGNYVKQRRMLVEELAGRRM